MQPKFKNFGAVVGTRSDEGRQEYLDYYKGAVDLPGPVSDRLAEIAKAHDVFIVCGLIERERGTLHCTVVFVSPTEGLVYKRRKVRSSPSSAQSTGTSPDDANPEPRPNRSCPRRRSD